MTIDDLMQGRHQCFVAFVLGIVVVAAGNSSGRRHAHNRCKQEQQVMSFFVHRSVLIYVNNNVNANNIQTAKVQKNHDNDSLDMELINQRPH